MYSRCSPSEPLRVQTRQVLSKAAPGCGLVAFAEELERRKMRVERDRCVVSKVRFPFFFGTTRKEVCPGERCLGFANIHISCA